MANIMKTRQGFVSNSSTSSFIVFKRDTTLSAEELKKRSEEAYIERVGAKVVSQKYYQNKIEGFVNDHKYVFLIQSLERDDDLGVEELVNNIFDKLNITDVSFELDDE